MPPHWPFRPESSAISELTTVHLFIRFTSSNQEAVDTANGLYYSVCLDLKPH